MLNNPLTTIGSYTTHENSPGNSPDFVTPASRFGWPARSRHAVACMHRFSHILRASCVPAVWIMPEWRAVDRAETRKYEDLPIISSSSEIAAVVRGLNLHTTGSSAAENQAENITRLKLINDPLKSFPANGIFQYVRLQSQGSDFWGVKTTSAGFFSKLKFTPTSQVLVNPELFGYICHLVLDICHQKFKYLVIKSSYINTAARRASTEANTVGNHTRFLRSKYFLRTKIQ